MATTPNPQHPQSAPPTPERTGNIPIHTIRHRNIKSAIWKNSTDKGPMYTVTPSRSYRDGEEWKDSHSFSYDEIMNLAKVLFDAHSYITTLREHDRAGGDTGEQPSPPPPNPRKGRRSQ